MSRRLKIALALCLLLVVLVGAALWALPEVVRRVAEAKLPELTGREVRIERVHLNPFTGRFAVDKVWMARRAGPGPERFVEFDRLEGRLSLASLLRSDVRLVELTLARPIVRITRTAPLEFDFSDLMRLFVRPVATERPSQWTFTLDRLSLTDGAVIMNDAFLSPPREWRIDGLHLESGGLTTRPGQPLGRLDLQAKIAEAPFRASSDSISLSPPSASLDVSLSGFDLVRLRPYLTSNVQAVPERGTLGFALRLERVRAGEELAKSTLAGSITLENLSVVRRGEAVSFLDLTRLVVAIKGMDFLAREVSLSAIEATGFTVKATRDAMGEIDLAAVVHPPPAPSASSEGAKEGPAAGPSDAPTAASPSGPPPERTPPVVRLERLTLREGALVLMDEGVSPTRQWRLEGVTGDGASFSTAAADPPATLKIRAQATAQPGSTGPTALTLDADSIKLAPGKASVRLNVERLPLAAVEPYWPPDLAVTAPVGTVGANVAVEVEQGDAGLNRLVAAGTVNAEGVAILPRGKQDPFIKIPKLAIGLNQIDVLANRVSLSSVESTGLEVKATRNAAGDIDLLEALRPRPAPPSSGHVAKVGATEGSSESASRSLPPRGPPPERKPPEVRLERLVLRQGALALTDDGVSPSRQWRVEGLTVNGRGLSTSPKDPPARLRVRAQVTAQPGSTGPTAIALDADALTLAPGKASARLSVQALPLAAVQPYLPPDLPMTAPTGSVGATLTVGVEQGGAGVSRLVAAGQVQAEDIAIVPRGRSEPFIKVPKLAIGLTQVDALARTVALDAVEIEGLDAHARRDANGNIDVLGFFSSAPPAVEIAKSRTGSSAGPPPAPMPAAPSRPMATPPSQTGNEWRVSLERFKLSKGTAAFDDQQVSPAARFTLQGVEVTADHVAWPLTKPATFTFLSLMPGGGWSYAKGTAVLEPLNVQIAISTRDTPITPYQQYFPFPARFEGLFNGDSLSEIQRGPQGELILASRGTAWSNEPKVLAPGATDPVASAQAVVFSDIDFSWPNYALVQRITFIKPRALIEREADGTINLRALFTAAKKNASKADAEAEAPPASKEAKPSSPPSAASGPVAPAAQPEVAAAEAPKRSGDGQADEGGLMQNMVIDFTDIAIEEGQATFVDRTTTPPFSEQISRLALTIHDLSNVLGRPQRTTLTAQALIGVDGALDMRGDLSGLGETLRADLIAELRDFSLPGTSPYTENLMSWNVRSGTLRAKIHYQVEGDRITAQHELEFKKLKVEKARESDEAKRRIGVPLGLAVALLKDSNGNIDFTFPLNGTLSDRQFDWGEAMWAAVKQVITKLVLAPFHAIGRLFKGSDDSVDALEIEPVTFPPGSAVIAPSLEAQLTRLAEFLRRSPSIKVALAPIVTTADVEKLNEQAVASRLEAYRREHSLPDLAGALAAYYQQRAPDAVRPKTVDEQIALLAQREPAPDTATADLARRRVDAVREDLVAARSIEAERVVTPAPAAEIAAAGGGEGRVEFNIVTDAK